jgi:hypothetical protein
VVSAVPTIYVGIAAAVVAALAAAAAYSLPLFFHVSILEEGWMQAK